MRLLIPEYFTYAQQYTVGYAPIFNTLMINPLFHALSFNIYILLIS